MENVNLSRAPVKPHPTFLNNRPSLALQIAILEDSAKARAFETCSVDAPLPNGELPLHYAVRENKPEIAVKLLTLGADIEKKDYQGLTAIEHAVLLQNEDMVARLLAHKIGADIEGVKGQIGCKGTEAHDDRLKQKIRELSTINRQTLGADQKNAYEGRLELLESETLAQEGIAHFIDDKGYSLVHYAILGGNGDLVEGLIQKCAIDINTVTKGGDSLLHIAAISGSAPMVEKLIALGANPNSRNHTGETALHYAAAKEKLSVLQALVKGGADPSLRDNENISPLALIGAAAYRKDPLALSKTQYILFGINALFWLATLARKNGGDMAQDNEETLKIIANSLFAASAMTGFAFAVHSSKASNKALGEMAFRNLVVMPIASQIMGLLEAKHVFIGTLSLATTQRLASSAFTGLRACLNNLRYRQWAAVRNAAVLTGNIGQSVYTLVWTTAGILNALSQGPQKEKIAPSVLKDLSPKERALHSKLDPKDIDDALKMVDPDFTVDKLEHTGKQLYEKPLRNLQLKFHPDKCRENDCAEAFSRLTQAKETLENYLGSSHERPCFL